MTQVKNFFKSLFNGLESMGTDIARRQVEVYLAQSQNIVELEQRMRKIENGQRRNFTPYI